MGAVAFPFGLRVKLGYDAALCRAVLAVWVRAVLGDYRQRAQRAGARGRGFSDGRNGAVTVIQRSSATLKLN